MGNEDHGDGETKGQQTEAVHLLRSEIMAGRLNPRGPRNRPRYDAGGAAVSAPRGLSISSMRKTSVNNARK